jgi:hypothetical protein
MVRKPKSGCRLDCGRKAAQIKLKRDTTRAYHAANKRRLHFSHAGRGLLVLLLFIATCSWRSVRGVTYRKWLTCDFRRHAMIRASGGAALTRLGQAQATKSPLLDLRIF